MINNLNIYNFDTLETAKNIYKSFEDMDAADYEESKEQTIEELESALYYLKTVAQNKHNADYFRTFYNAITLIFNK